MESRKKVKVGLMNENKGMMEQQRGAGEVGCL